LVTDPPDIVLKSQYWPLISIVGVVIWPLYVPEIFCKFF
jgi:hypothetical protein